MRVFALSVLPCLAVSDLLYATPRDGVPLRALCFVRGAAGAKLQPVDVARAVLRSRWQGDQPENMGVCSTSWQAWGSRPSISGDGGGCVRRVHAKAYVCVFVFSPGVRYPLILHCSTASASVSMHCCV
jgi:hypothetical protein